MKAEQIKKAIAKYNQEADVAKSLGQTVEYRTAMKKVSRAEEVLAEVLLDDVWAI